MSLFKKNLPVTICPIQDNEQGNKYQAILKAVDKQYILLETAHSFELASNTDVTIEFILEHSRFHFDTQVFNLAGRSGILLKKPNQIHRSKLREGPRVPLVIKINYTPWTEEKRYTVETRDMSESGVRIQGLFEIPPDSIVSLDFYIKDAKIRVISQGVVSWSKPDPENEIFYQSGIQFSTISNEARKKLAKYLLDLHESRKE